MSSSVFNHINEANKITPISCFYIFLLFPRVPLTRYSPRKCNQNVWFHFMVVGCLLAPSYIFHVSLALQTNLVLPPLLSIYEYMQSSIRLNKRYLLSLYICSIFLLASCYCLLIHISLLCGQILNVCSILCNISLQYGNGR